MEAERSSEGAFASYVDVEIFTDGRRGFFLAGGGDFLDEEGVEEGEGNWGLACGRGIGEVGGEENGRRFLAEAGAEAGAETEAKTETSVSVEEVEIIEEPEEGGGSSFVIC